MSDTPTDKNLRVVYSPLGEKFEVSPANFYDLTRNAPKELGWTEHKPHPDVIREHCAKTGVALPAELSGETPAPAAPPAPAPVAPPAPAPVAPPAPAPVAPPAPAPVTNTNPPAPETADGAGEQTVSGEAPEEVQKADEGVALKTVPSDFADMDKDAVRDYIVATFSGVEIDGRKGRDALVAQALELAAARAA